MHDPTGKNVLQYNYIQKGNGLLTEGNFNSVISYLSNIRFLQS